ncbi:acetyl-CoA acetyltransferase, partial [Mycobacterium avium subsp. paratuberculosis 10-5975]
MGTPVIVGAVRTAIGRSFKGTLVNTPPETLITAVLPEVIRRSGVDPAAIDDIIFAESHYGGGDLARYAAAATGLEDIPGQSVNRHCAGSLTAIGNAAAQIGSGMERVLIAGGVQSLSMTPLVNWRIPGPELKFEERWMPPTHVEAPDAPTRDMSITVGWNTAKTVGITREEMDAWAARSHQRAIAAIDAGKFVDEILPLKITQVDGSVTEFAIDEHPRRDTTVEKLAGLKVLHPEIEGFSITAGNSSGTNDAAAAVALVDREYAEAEKLN